MEENIKLVGPPENVKLVGSVGQLCSANMRKNRIIICNKGCCSI